MEPKEEQETELEALEAIFNTDFRILEPANDSSGVRFEINLSLEGCVNLQIIFTHSLTYPQTPIQLVVYALDGLSATNRKNLQTYLDEYAENNIDQCVAYDICQNAQEWVIKNQNSSINGTNINQSTNSVLQEDQDSQFETRDVTQQEKVEVILRKAVGTPVTVESFSAWRQKFTTEIQAMKTPEQIRRESNPKQTGRQLFENKSTVVSAESESFWEAEAEMIESGAT